MGNYINTPEDEARKKAINRAWVAMNTRYTIFQNNKKVETDISNWQTAIAHARKWQYDLFENVKKVEILNQWTGEIYSLEEAEERLKKWLKSKGASQ